MVGVMDGPEAEATVEGHIERAMAGETFVEDRIEVERMW